MGAKLRIRECLVQFGEVCEAMNMKEGENP